MSFETWALDDNYNFIEASIDKYQRKYNHFNNFNYKSFVLVQRRNWNFEVEIARGRSQNR